MVLSPSQSSSHVPASHFDTPLLELDDDEDAPPPPLVELDDVDPPDPVELVELALEADPPPDPVLLLPGSIT